MPEARSRIHPRPALPAAPPRRVVGAPRPGPVVPATEPLAAHPLDPPLVDVRIPVKAPHATATAYSRAALMHRFPDAEVGDDLHMLFSEPGEAKQSRLSPDVMVALNVPRRGTRADYDADRLGPPDFVLEVLSRSTWEHDVGRKLDCYQRIGVRECLLFDAGGGDLAGVGKELWGFALTPERREPLAEAVLPNGARGVRSAVLGLVAHVAERTPPAAPGETWALTMRWHDPATAADIPDYDQSRASEARALAEAQAERAKARAERAKARTERTRARMAESEARAACGRADAAQREAQAARVSADAAQRRITELVEQLGRRRDGP